MKEMREIKAQIKKAADAELLRANTVHEPRFVDEAHRFGVLYGELKELKAEYARLLEQFALYETYELIYRGNQDVIDLVEEMRKTALSLAAEAVQYIAMCEKALASLYHEQRIEDIFKGRDGGRMDD